MKLFSGNSKSWNVDHTYDDVDDKDSERGGSISTISGGSKRPAYSSDPSLILESPLEKKLRKRSHWVAYATMFVMTMGFSVVLSGVWPYLSNMEPGLSKTSLGWVVAANPFGQMIASPIVGYLGNRLGSIRIICYFTMTFFILGNLLYSFLPLMTDFWTNSAFHIMIFSRFIVGLSSSNVTLCRSYLASSTTTKERTTGIAIISAAQSFGFVIGPTIQTVLSLAIEDENLKYRSAGWVAALLGVFNFVLLTPWIFQEYNIAAREHEILKLSDENKDKKLVIPKTDYLALGGVLFGFFMNQFIYVLLETLMEPFLTDQYEWCNDIAVVVVGVAFAAAGIMAILMFITATRLAKRFDERKILIFCAFVPISIGVFLFIPWGPEKLNYCEFENLYSTIAPFTTTGSSLVEGVNYTNDTSIPLNFFKMSPLNSNMASPKSGTKEWCDPSQCYGCPSDQEWCIDYNKLPMAQFFIAFAIVVLGYPFGVSMSNAIFSKILGPKPQGLWMGVLTASGSLSRVLGPIFVSYLYTTQGTTLTFAVLFCGMIIAIAELTLLYKRIVPMKVIVVENEKRI